MARTLHERSDELLRHRVRRLKRDQRAFRFVFLGDSRGPNNTCFLSGELELLLKRAVRRKPLFIVHGGDTVYSGNREYLQHFVHVVERLAPRIPMFVCVGNHDELYIGESNVENFRATVGKVHWQIDVPQFRFRCAALNNILNPGSPGLPATYGFTPAELRTGPRHTPLAMHVEPAVGRWSGLDGFAVVTPTGEEFLHLVAHHRVEHVLQSHVHAYDEQFVEKKGKTVTLGNGSEFTVSGGAGAPLDEEPLTYNNYHFLEFSVTRGPSAGNRVSSPDLFRVFGTPRVPCL